MANATRRAAAALAWVGGVTMVGGLLLTAAGPRPVAAAPAGPKPPDGPFKLAGILECQRCHNERNPADNPALVAAGSIDFVRMSENRVWGSHDLHSRAYQNLSGPTGRQMERVLAAARGDGYKVTKDVACLACHATDRDPGVPWAKKTAASFSTFQGVNCEMCHGYASKWVNEHARTDEADGKITVPWREWPPAVKAEWGLVNLRDPQVRADTCAACHVGNLAEGRFVTHEMYAAGHPPLPPLDVTAYARDQPRHWGTPAELAYHQKLAKADPAKAWSLFHYRAEDAEVSAAREFAVATAAAFRASARLLAQQAASPNEGLDFAAFDCYSCHHDLKVPSARQQRGYAGIPGRPTFRPSLLSLVRVVADHAAGMPDAAGPVKAGPAALDAAQQQLNGAFVTRTFGDPAKVRPACEAMAAWADGFVAGLDKVRYTRPEAERLLAAVVDAGAADKPVVADPETAELLTWAVQTLSDGLAKSGPKPPAAFAEALGRLDGVVVTRLRADPLKTKPVKPAVEDPLSPTGKVTETPVPVEDRLKERMSVFNGFDPDSFRAAFQKLKAAERP